MTIDEFFKSVIGKKIDIDGAYGNQCVDLIKAYEKNCLGLVPEAVGDAWEYYESYYKKPFLYKHFKRITNTPEFIPAKGDICVFTRGFGKYGHVSIATGRGDLKIFESIDQNAGGNLEACKYVTHTYNNFYGVLRPKNYIDNTFIVKVTCDVLRVRSGAGLNYDIKQRVKKNEVYTIVDTINKDGYTWGKLKSGAGFIALEYTRRI